MVRFQFRGFDRESGEPVEGHVEAFDEEMAYDILSKKGIIAEPPLREEPKPLNGSPDTAAVAQFADALNSALDSSSSQVAFDDLTKRYRGKKVWVIDREKIRDRVAEVVDSTLAASEGNLETGTTARERVADAISGLFHDTRNIASEHNAKSIAEMRAMVGGAAQGANGIAAMTDAGLAEQIGRLTGVVEQAEGLIAAMSAALRNVESGVGPRRRPSLPARSTSHEQAGVLHEIFQSNVDLRRALSGSAPPVESSRSTLNHLQR